MHARNYENIQSTNELLMHTGNLCYCRKYVKSQKARGGTGTPVHTRHRHSVEYDEETREEVKRETRGGSPRFSFPYPVFLLVNL